MSASRIQSEALKLFAQKGYEGTSVREIAKKADLTVSALYSHFKSKEMLYLEIFDASILEFTKGIIDIISKVNCDENKQALYRIYIYFVYFYMNISPESTFILRNTMFPPNDLQDQINDILILKTKESQLAIEKMFEACFDTKAIPNEIYVNSFFKMIYGFIMDITARKTVFTIKELDKQWETYWRLIQLI